MSFSITLINQTDGTVDGHRAGCADIKRSRKHADEPWTFEVDSKRDAYLAYNADFIAESGEEEGHWEINWLPCAHHVPETTPAAETFPAHVPGIGIKRGPKWTYLFSSDGAVIARFRNDAVGTLADVLKTL